VHSTVGWVLARAGLSNRSDLDSVEPIVRYEAPGDLPHIDTKKLGRIDRAGHRVTGSRLGCIQGAGWEMLFVAVDDHARIGFTELYLDEKVPSAVQFLRKAVAYYKSLDVKVKRLLTDNDPPFRSRDFAQACLELGVRHQFTRVYRPRPTAEPST
jgi:transposase InsO family protein